MAKYFRNPVKRAITNAADAVRRQIGTIEGSRWIVPKDYLTQREALYARVNELRKTGVALATAAKTAIKEISTLVIEEIRSPWINRKETTYAGTTGLQLENALKQRNKDARAEAMSVEYAQKRAEAAGFDTYRLHRDKPTTETFKYQADPSSLLSRRSPKQLSIDRYNTAISKISKSLNSAGVDDVVKSIVLKAVSSMSRSQLSDVSNLVDLHVIYDSESSTVTSAAWDVINYARKLSGFDVSDIAADILEDYQRSPKSLDAPYVYTDDEGEKQEIDRREYLQEEFGQ